MDFASLYDGWFPHVCRWLRALSVPDADIEDISQDVFLVVRRRLHDFDGHNVPGWLYRIAARQARQHRRRRWVQTFFSQRHGVDPDDLPWGGSSAVSMLETREKQRLLERMLGKLSEKRRVAFWLFEVEGYGGEEIAEILDVPLNTVWTRLHHARKDFFVRLADYRRAHKEES
ncbi:MAG: sigma-70 family RNA polymerase sigma factor [Polyangiaceae bacterium]